MARRDVDVFALLDGQLAKVSDSDTNGEVRKIPLKKIMRNNLNFYPALDDKDMDALVDSIKANGLLEPLAVVPQDDYYRLISGHNRFSALLRLQAQAGAVGGYNQEVLCRVLPPMTPAQELTAVIEANRQRVKSDAILAEEARRLTEAYTKRKEAGEELPGRIRDRVADDLGVNPTKLANLSAIRNGLKNQRFIDLWQRNAMTESCALEIARMDGRTQDFLSEWLEREKEECLLRTVREFKAISFKIDHDCELAGAPCPNARNMYAAFCQGGNWEGCCGCCDMCLRNDTCDNCCAFVEHEEPSSVHESELGGMGIAPPPKLENRVELSAEDWQVRRERFSQRLRAARESTGLDRAAFAEKIGEYKATYSAWENGNLPGSGAFPRLAQALGVSTDYLYGLTDDPEPKPGPAVLNQNCGNSESKDGMSFGERLRKARKAKGLTQNDLAEKMGRTAQNVNQYELGLRSPKIETAQTFANALGVSVSELLNLPIQPDDFPPGQLAAQWQVLDEAHWPADQQLVILCWDNGLGEFCYATARCVGSYHDTYPFEDTDVGCYLDEPSNGKYDIGFWWMPLPEKEDQHESDDT